MRQIYKIIIFEPWDSPVTSHTTYFEILPNDEVTTSRTRFTSPSELDDPVSRLRAAVNTFIKKTSKTEWPLQ
jgi:hypothetical protein